VCLGALEVAARVVERGYKGGGGKEQHERLQIAEPDPLLGWRKHPGGKAVYERRDYRVEVTINSHGLRDPERDNTLRPGALRVLALGDSFVEAFMVRLEETVTQRLEAELARRPYPVEVINGGTSGYSTDQEYLFYREEGYRYEPRIVVLFFYYNDILYNAMDHNIHIPKPLLDMSGARPRVVNFPVPPQPRPAEALPETTPPPHAHSAALRWLAARLERSAPRAYDAIASTGLWPRLRKLPISPEFRVYMNSLTPEAQAGWRMTGEILGAIEHEASGHGARLLVAYVPSKMEVDDESWELTQIRYGLRPGHWDRSRVVRKLASVCAERSVPLLDLTPALRKAMASGGGALYFESDSHWNAQGQLVAAREIAHFLNSEGWLPERVQ
jgi:hypothetical protein